MEAQREPHKVDIISLTLDSSSIKSSRAGGGPERNPSNDRVLPKKNGVNYLNNLLENYEGLELIIFHEGLILGSKACIFYSFGNIVLDLYTFITLPPY